MPGPQWSGQPQPRSSSGGSNSTTWMVLGAVAAVAVIVFLFVMLGKDDGGAGGPEDAAKQLLDASRDQDLSAAQGIMCQADLSSGFFADNLEAVKVATYTIDNVESEGDVTIVHASMQMTDGEAVSDVQIPVVQEGGDWKVCFDRRFPDPSSGSDGSDFDTDVPPPSGDSDLTVPSDFG